MSRSSARMDLRQADRELVELVKDLRILGQLSWPREEQYRFLADWRAGRRRLPEVVYPQLELGDRITALRRIISSLPVDSPEAEFLNETARSYIKACRMLESLGSAELMRYSVELYGQPGDSLAGGAVNNRDAARHFLEISTAPGLELGADEAGPMLSSTDFAAAMRERLREVFESDLLAVEVDDNLVSKAAAGATRIRIRGQTHFRQDDLEQLVQHEAFVHSLTAINGLQQPRLTAMGLSAPRTIGTQEGLATFAELVTGAIDLARLNRIAMRILAIDKAINGADFLEIFELMLDAGQSETESFYSAMRVFRGVPVTGGAAFTKDTVYLHGLMEIHTFFRWAIAHQRFDYCRHLFAGRMTIGDVIRLAPCFESGAIAGPKYLPSWMKRRNGLAAYLAFSVFANRIRISELGEGYRFDRLEEIGI